MQRHARAQPRKSRLLPGRNLWFPHIKLPRQYGGQYIDLVMGEATGLWYLLLPMIPRLQSRVAPTDRNWANITFFFFFCSHEAHCLASDAGQRQSRRLKSTHLREWSVQPSCMAKRALRHLWTLDPRCLRQEPDIRGHQLAGSRRCHDPRRSSVPVHRDHRSEGKEYRHERRPPDLCDPNGRRDLLQRWQRHLDPEGVCAGPRPSKRDKGAEPGAGKEPKVHRLHNQAAGI
jgi:hypothetical protein